MNCYQTCTLTLKAWSIFTEPVFIIQVHLVTECLLKNKCGVITKHDLEILYAKTDHRIIE